MSAAQLPERYTVRRKLGAGGMGIVWEVWDRERGQAVALKTIREPTASRLFGFKREFRALADIAHPNLVQLYELSEHDGQWFFTMELVVGQHLLNHVRSRAAYEGAELDTTSTLKGPGRPRPREHSRQRARAADPLRLRAVFPQLAAALAYLHDHGYLHCDVKPSNVLVSEDGRAVLCDFGLVTHAPATGIGGTAGYMAPEQAAGGALTTACDWYSFGVVLYEALTGQRPWADTPLRPSLLADDVDADLEALCMALIANDPAARPTGDEVCRRLHESRDRTFTPARTMFVGRDAELAIFHQEHVQVAATGVGRIVRVSGGSGIGKSALVARFLEQVPSGTVVLHGRCYERETVPYKALDSVIDALSERGVEIADALRRSVELVRLFPVLERTERRVLRAQPEIDDVLDWQRRAAISLRELLALVAEGRSLIVVIDDLHWGDHDSALLLAELMRPPAPAMLLIATYRDEVGAVGAELIHALEDAGSPCRTIELGALSDIEATAMVRASLPERCREIAAIAQGHPLLLSELVHSASAGVDAGAVELDALILARIAELPAAARELLRVVSVIGRPVEERWVRRVATIDELDRATLHTLRARHLVKTAGARGDELDVYHDWIRQAVIAAITPAELRELHRRIAAVLEELAPSEHELLATHWAAAGATDQAIAHATIAAQTAATALAFDRAARMYQLSLSLSPPAATERYAILTKLGGALAHAGRGGEAADALLDAIVLAPRDEARELERRAAEQLLRSGRVAEGVTLAEMVLQELGLHVPSSPMHALASTLARRAESRATGVSFTPRDAADIDPTELATIDTLWSMAVGFGLVDSIRGAHFQSQHLSRALAVGEPGRVVRALAVEIAYRSAGGVGNRAKVLELEASARALATSLGDPLLVGWTIGASACAAYQVGDWRLVVSHLADAAEQLRRRVPGTSILDGGLTWELATLHNFELGGLYYLGRLRELAIKTARYLVDADRRGDVYASTQMRTWHCNTRWLVADDLVRARADVDRAARDWPVERFHLQHFYRLQAAVQIELYAGNVRAAHAMLAERWPVLEASLLLKMPIVNLEAHALAARCAIACADLDRAEQSLASIRDTGMSCGSALADLHHAAVELRHGRSARARELLASAATGFDAQHMAMHATIARLQLAQLDGRDAAVELGWLQEQGVREPARFAAMIAPG